MNKVTFRLVLISFCLVAASGCSHSLTIKNLQDYCVPICIEESEKKINMGIKPTSGNSDQIWYANAIVENLNVRREIGKLNSNYVEGRCNFSPNYILSIEPQAEYKSSGWNYLVNFPGGIIFTPAWNGYVYYVNITTNVVICGEDGNELNKFTVDTRYSIRHSEFDRTWYPLFSFNVLNSLGGFYTAFVYDSDITPEVKADIKTNYSSYIVDKIMNKIKEAETSKRVL